MDDLLRQLELGGLSARLLLLGTALSLVGALLGLVLGTRSSRRHGSSRPAIFAAVALALPLGLIFGLGLEMGRFDAPAVETRDPASAVAMLREDLAIRRITGWSGLLLALPMGGAAGLWAGIAAVRRTRRAGERARLAARAIGEVEIGHAVASALDRYRSPEVGAAIGILAGIAVAGIPGVGLLLSTATLEHALVDLVHLDPVAAPIYLRVATAGASRTLLAAALAGALGVPIAALFLGTAIHAASSRRRNLAVAERVLVFEGARPAVRAAITSALEATGKPGPTKPVLIALVLLLLAALAIARAATLVPNESPAPADELASAVGHG